MAVDKTGRKLKVGQMVETILMGGYQGKVVDIKEQPIMLSATQGVGPHLVILVSIHCPIDQAGRAGICIIQDADPKDPLVIEANEGPRLVKP